jgi:site-specific recombinase XerD
VLAHYLPWPEAVARGDGRARGRCMLSAHGRPLTGPSLVRIVRARAAAAGLPGWVTPHTFRHCFTTHWLEGGGDLATVSQVLGHESVATTADIYAHLSQDQVAKEYSKHPRAG